MNSDNQTSLKPLLKNVIAVLFISLVGFLPAQLQIKYTHVDERWTSDFEIMPYFEVQDEPFTCFPLI